MALYSDPPPLHQFSEDKPTLLVCWWITTFCAVIVLLRITGRFVRTERLFTEDKTAALAVVPLFLRMGCIHVVLTYGTNNAQLAGAALSDEDLHRKSVASGLVLLSRVLYAATLWIFKYAILEFFRRLNVNWERSYDLALLGIRVVLIATFVAVVISDLAECQPFSHYWQVLPDPGGQCRQGYAQLLTMAVCNILTDLLLVLFPVPVILRSGMTTKRKVQLVLLFSLSLAPVAVTIYRVPHIIQQGGSQQARSLYASVELLFATAAANALVLGSFVRDRGVKKRRFKYESIAATSLDRSSAYEYRRPIALRDWGSDEDLARDLGYGVITGLRDTQQPSPTDNRYFIPAPVVKSHEDMNTWQFPSHKLSSPETGHPRNDNNKFSSSIRSDSTATQQRVSFFDPGGLINDHNGSSSSNSSNSNISPAAAANPRESGVSSDQSTSPIALPEPTLAAGLASFRGGSAALLQDLGGFLTTRTTTATTPALSRQQQQQQQQQQARPNLPRKSTGEHQVQAGPPPPLQRRGSYMEPSGKPSPELMDVGGLLKTRRD